MRIRHLRYFRVVAEELSFSRAAARVHIEPSPPVAGHQRVGVGVGGQLIPTHEGRYAPDLGR